MKKRAVTALLLASSLISSGQTTAGQLTFALPEHPGRMVVDQGPWKIQELSAKPNGREWGERASSGNATLLAFLFVWPEKAPLTSASCRDEMIKAEHAEASVKGRQTLRSSSGADIALALLVSPQNGRTAVRAFVASGDLCGDLLFTTSDAGPGDMELYKKTLQSLRFQPDLAPDFQSAFAYASAEFLKHQYAGAATAYRTALLRVNQSGDSEKYRRVVTDQLSMALGISGDLKGSRALNEAAIDRDPNYPMYYYNLACADAEAGDVAAARKHLQAAFDRRANTLEGETLPDPSADDSIQKLKSNKAFWVFVENLSAQTKQGAKP